MSDFRVRSETRYIAAPHEVTRLVKRVGQSAAALGDPARRAHIGDRECDIYELFCTAHEIGMVAIPWVTKLGCRNDRTLAQ